MPTPFPYLIRKGDPLTADGINRALRGQQIAGVGVHSGMGSALIDQSQNFATPQRGVASEVLKKYSLLSGIPSAVTYYTDERAVFTNDKMPCKANKPSWFLPVNFVNPVLLRCSGTPSVGTEYSAESGTGRVDTSGEGAGWLCVEDANLELYGDKVFSFLRTSAGTDVAVRLTVTATLDENLAIDGTATATVVTADNAAAAYAYDEFTGDSPPKFEVADVLGLNDVLPSGTKIEAMYKGHLLAAGSGAYYMVIAAACP